MKEQDRVILRKLLLLYVPKSARILDVGCGLGKNILMLNALGYPNVVGVDVSPEMVSATRSRNIEAYVFSEFQGHSGSFDLILFSHVIEHFEYKDLQRYMEFYLSRLVPRGKFIILAPVLYDAFYSDVDHIKPYYPKGLMNLFSDDNLSRQYSSRYVIRILDIYFRRANLTPYFMRSRYIKKLWNRIVFKTLNTFFEFMKVITFDLFSKTTGYGAIFEVTKSRDCS